MRNYLTVGLYIILHNIIIITLSDVLGIYSINANKYTNSIKHITHLPPLIYRKSLKIEEICTNTFFEYIYLKMEIFLKKNHKKEKYVLKEI